MTGARFGMALQAARQNEGRVAALGIDRPTGSSWCSLRDLGHGHRALPARSMPISTAFVSPTMMSWHLSGEIMVFVILGGVGRLFGPVVGACLFMLFEHAFGSFTEYWQFFLACRAAGGRAVRPGWFHWSASDGEGASHD
jgi:branched-chain amino acid transport system permease protein